VLDWKKKYTNLKEEMKLRDKRKQ